MSVGALDGIRDLDAFVNDALTRGLRRCNGRLEPSQREKAFEFLKDKVVELAETYDPTLNSSFSKFAFGILPFRLVDWYRKELGDSRYSDREVTEVVSMSDAGDELEVRDRWMAQRWAEEVEFRVAFTF